MGDASSTRRHVLPALMLALILAAFLFTPGKASAQCCDLVIEVSPDVRCCVGVLDALWSQTGTMPIDRAYCPNASASFPMPCPNRLLSVRIATSSGPVTIPYGTVDQVVEIVPGCCVYVSLNNNWPPAPCYFLQIRSAPCVG